MKYDEGWVNSNLLHIRWYPRPVLRLVEIVRVRRLPTWVELLVPWRLCGSWQAVAGDHLSPARLQNQISGELLLTSRKPRMREYKSNLRVSNSKDKPKTSSRLMSLFFYFSIIDSMTNANDDTTSSYGRLSQIALTACRSPLSVRLTPEVLLIPSNFFLYFYSRWKNLLLSRWPQSRSPIHGTDSPDHATNRRTGSRIIMRFVVVRSR